MPLDNDILKSFRRAGHPHDNPLADTTACPRNSTSQPLANIEEDHAMCLPLAYQPPETPEETMEFLSRSWSISALEVAKALNTIDSKRRVLEGERQVTDDHALSIAPFSFASATTAQTVMDRIMSNSDMSPFPSRRNSHSSGPLSYIGSGHAGVSPPISPRQADDLNTWLLQQQSTHSDKCLSDCSNSNKQFCRSASGMRGPLHGMSIKGWLKDSKEKKKETLRMHNSQVHAAMSVAGVASAIAAVAASKHSTDEDAHKTSMAVASAAALVAAHCVEVAESMGANHEQMAAVVRSAVSVKTPGDVMTLTAAAATALRGAATLKARNLKNHHSHATVIPYERGNGNGTALSGELVSEESESEHCNQDILRGGGEFLKRTSKGELHWRMVYVYLNKNSQVVVKSRTRYMGGSICKSKKRFVRDIIMHIPAWPERDILNGENQRRYFGIKTDHGIMELECKNENEYRLWTEGIAHLLCMVKNRQSL